MFKLRSFVPFILLSGLCLSFPAQSLVIDLNQGVGAVDQQDVGLADILHGISTTGIPGGGNPSDEETWAESWLTGVDLTYSGTKTETVQWYNGSDTTIGDFIAFELVTDPGYYILKNSNFDYVLLENVDDLGWGVLDSSDTVMDSTGATITLGDFIDSLGSDMTISHITEFNPVPEPSILALMGLGIFGLGLSRRRMKK